jgi:hypothetical protein
MEGGSEIVRVADRGAMGLVPRGGGVRTVSGRLKTDVKIKMTKRPGRFLTSPRPYVINNA